MRYNYAVQAKQRCIKPDIVIEVEWCRLTLGNRS
jgi:hypothetical protein